MFLKSAVIEQIYNVPLGRSCWREVIEVIRAEMSAALGLMFPAHPNQAPVFVTTTGKDESIWKMYERDFWQIDPWNEVLQSPKIPNNSISNGYSYIAEKRFKQTTYYNEFWKKMSLGETAGGKIMTNNGIMVQLGFPKYIDQPHYTPSETSILQQYCMHIKKAIELEGYTGQSLPKNIYEHGLVAQFGLTRAEAQLVLALVQCDTLKQAAEQLFRSYHTVRSQLKAIYQKTETNSQLGLFKRLFKCQDQ